ncbi:MAG: glycosyltransferase family 2 protein [Methanobrevibacter thaueri]|nr:glycosyltransferase family 2 protein [Methanobrevibacter thaueri]
MYKISIIIPIYNAEKYISRCISSLLNQTMNFDELEVILIDDNSSDNSKAIIEQYVTKYKNLKGIYLKNNHGGPSIPRNEGIKIASAKYIMFMDNDDEYDSKMCETLYNNLISNNADFVSCRECRVNSNNKIYIENPYVNYDGDIIFLNGEDILKFDDLVVWNKIFKKDIILKNNILFPNSRNEDYYFCYVYFIHSKSAVYLQNYYGYKWYNTEGSLSSGFKYSHYYGLLNMYTKLCKILNENHIDSKLFFNKRIYGNILLPMFSENILKKDDKKIFDLFEQYVKFEEELSQPHLKTNIVYTIGRHLLLNKKFKLAKTYFKVITKLYHLI